MLACTTEDPVSEEPAAPGGITLSIEGPLEAKTEGDIFSVTIKSPVKPSVSPDRDWVTVNYATYNPKTFLMPIQLVVAPNDGDERSCTVTFSSGAYRNQLTIHQDAWVRPEIDKSKISAEPVNPKASAEAKKLYSYLLGQYGTKTISGVQSSHSHTNDVVDAVYKATGSHPALAGYDFIFLPFSPTPPSWSWQRDYTDISAQKEHWKAGGIVCYMWHWNVPDSEDIYRGGGTDGYGFYVPGANSGNGNTTFDIREALKENTWQHEFILKDIDKMAQTLKLLQDAHIPILFRPLHEAAGNYTRYDASGGAWFWWGRYGAEPCKQLWTLLQDRLQNYHGLNNILWVWTVDVADGYLSAAKQWYPGNDKVDIVGFDVYADDNGLRGREYAFLDAVTEGTKMLTVSECGNIPSPEKNINAGYPWSWFMVWPTAVNDNINISGFKLNTNAYWRQLMSSKYVITRENTGI
ncbi:MAG: hypothetical protein IJ813_06260 [Bacteroidales bacterium]|nr:hypothetical protein [Bacteroidales bacterium]